MLFGSNVDVIVLFLYFRHYKIFKPYRRVFPIYLNTSILPGLIHAHSHPPIVPDESRYMAFSQGGSKLEEEPYDHIKDSAFFYDVTEQFKQQMLLDTLVCKKCEVTTVSKVISVKATQLLFFT